MKENLRRAISILSEEVPQKWHLFWLKHERECGQARTCPLWKLAPQKLFALHCYQCVYAAWCVCACLHASVNSFHSSDSSGCPWFQIADRDSPLVFLHLEMELKECWCVNSEEIEPDWCQWVLCFHGFHTTKTSSSGSLGPVKFHTEVVFFAPHLPLMYVLWSPSQCLPSILNFVALSHWFFPFPHRRTIVFEESDKTHAKKKNSTESHAHVCTQGKIYRHFKATGMLV